MLIKSLGMMVIGFLAANAAFATTFNGITDLSEKSFQELVINGPATLKDIKAGKLTVNGPLTFQKIDVSGNTELNGPVKGTEAHFENLTITGSIEADKMSCNNLTVIGPATLKYFSIKENAEVKGTFKSDGGTVQDLSVMSSASLTDTTAKNVIIKHNNAYDQESKTDVLELKGKTIITGDVTFASGKGEVIVQGKDASIGGKINGGVLVDNSQAPGAKSP